MFEEYSLPPDEADEWRRRIVGRLTYWNNRTLTAHLDHYTPPRAKAKNRPAPLNLTLPPNGMLPGIPRQFMDRPAR